MDPLSQSKSFGPALWHLIKPTSAHHGQLETNARAARCAAAATLVIAVLCGGCMRFTTLKDQVKQLDTDLYLVGNVERPAGARGSTVIVTYSQAAPDRFDLAGITELGTDETAFAFSLPAGKEYYIFAFQDRNGNHRYEEGELFWINGRPDPVKFDAQHRSGWLAVKLHGGTLDANLAAGFREARSRGLEAVLADNHDLPVALGRISNFDAPRFQPDAGTLGLWEPAAFLNKYGLGIYFLEPYDPHRIPVLFVHGAGGTPGNWKNFAHKLDPRRFQVWLYSYPSGIPLASAAQALEAAVAALHDRYGFARMDVVAHSMGGLVAREFILEAAAKGRAAWLRNFITLSTPWLGHEAAALGVKYAPTAIPSWRDLETGSEFTHSVFSRPLPATTTYHLGFTFHGGNSMSLPPSNDGVVSLASQLAEQAQASAVSLRGFDASHVGVLSDGEAIHWVETLLPPAAAPVASPIASRN
jgi:pimeloyl-ACP methyl ester carboxylesterase